MKSILIHLSLLLAFILCLPLPSSADVSPIFCKSGCRFSFDLAGKIENIPLTSPLAKFNGASYTATGYFTNSGALDITQLKVDGVPGACTTGCSAELDPGHCSGGCLTAVNDGGKFTVSLNMPLTGTFGTVTNVSTHPTFKLVFPDPTGTMTLADLPGNLQQLEAIQFPTLGLSTTELSEIWAPSVSTFQLGLTNADGLPGACKGGCKYSFSLSGRIQDIPSSSPLAAYNGYYYTANGAFFGNGALNFGEFRMSVDPGQCVAGCINAEVDPVRCGAGGCLVAEPEPTGCDGGCFNLTLNPALLFSSATLGPVNTLPSIKFSFNNPTGALTLDSLTGNLSQLKSVSFPSIGFSAGSGGSVSGQPTVTTYSLLLASIPPTSAITDPVNGGYLKGTTSTVTGTADDTGSPGLQQVEVGITPNGGTTTWYPATGTASWSYPWILPTDGIYTIQSRATDTNSLAETPGTGVTVTVDNTPPTLVWGSAKPLPNATGWYNANVSLPFTTADNLSGVASTSSISPLIFNTEGSAVKGTVTVTDKAGNAATFNSANFRIDTTAPKVEAYALPSEARRSSRNETVLVFGTVADSLSGPDTTGNSGSYTITDSAGTNNSSGKFTVAKLGPLGKYGYAFTLNLPTTVPKSAVKRTYAITVKTKDKAGNVGTDSTTFVVK